MPFVFRFNRIRFHFFSNEGELCKPLLIQAQRAECLAKICFTRCWLWLISMGSLLANSSSYWNGLLCMQSNSKGSGMNTLAKSFRFDDSMMWLSQVDGRQFGVPLAFFPLLLQA